MTEEIKERLLRSRPESVPALQGEAEALRRVKHLILRAPLPNPDQQSEIL
jgi:hypothetical protein